MFNTWRIFFSGRTLILAVFLAAALFAGRGVDRAHADGSTSGAPFAPADVFLAIMHGQVQHRGPNGEFKHLLDNGLGDTGPDPNIGYGSDVQRMAFLPDGSLLVTDMPRQVIHRFDTTGAYAGTFGGALGFYPRSIAIDGDGNVFVGSRIEGEWAYSRLQKFSPPGTLLATSTLAGGAEFLAFRGGNCELLYTSDSETIRRAYVCAGPVPPGWDVFATVTDECLLEVRAVPDGRVVVAAGCLSSGRVFGSDGALLRTFAAPVGATMLGAAVVGDGPAVWLSDQGGIPGPTIGNYVYQMNMDSGATIMSFSDGVTGDGIHNATSLATFPGTPLPKPIIFVHGVQQDSASTIAFGAVLNDPAMIPSVVRFEYFQDLDDNGVCNRLRPVPAVGMPIWDLTSQANQHCDSESDFGLNVVLLHADIQAAYQNSGGQKVILIGYSMGAALIRGVLTYSSLLAGDLVAPQMIDSVFFIAAAMDGSPGAQCEIQRKCPPGTPKFVIDAIGIWGPESGIDTSRPALHQLIPRNAWYLWANPGPLPANIGYYEAHGNVVFKDYGLRAWVSLDKKKTVWRAGDGVLPTGTNDPFDAPAGGGASFARANTAEQWQWVFCNEEWNITLQGASLAAVQLKFDPCFHSNIPTKLDDLSLHVTDCVTGSQVGLGEQLRKILRGKLGSEAYACPRH